MRLYAMPTDISIRRNRPVKIAVFDTYVLRPDGRKMHFDILVRDQPSDKELGTVLAHGRRYLAAKEVPAESLSAQQQEIMALAELQNRAMDTLLLNNTYVYAQ